MVVLASYCVVGLFGLTYWLVQHIWANTSSTTALIVAASVAAPIALTLVWQRLSALKAFGVEVSLTTIAAPQFTVARLSDVDMAFIQDSGKATPSFTPAVQRLVKLGRQTVEVDLRETAYWWPSRLFLLSIALDELGSTRAMIFTAGPGRRFVGVCRPGDLARALGRETIRFTGGESVSAMTRYRAAKRETYDKGRKPTNDDEGIGQVYGYWNLILDSTGQPEVEPEEKYGKEENPIDLVDERLWRRLLGPSLNRSAVIKDPWDDPRTLARRVISADDEICPIVQKGNLVMVASRSNVALDVAGQTLQVRRPKGDHLPNPGNGANRASRRWFPREEEPVLDLAGPRSYSAQ